ncbi:MAG: hypothetical protein FWB85_05960 [Chitinispirillia bacterium]|nr:hypothetical protein [Chitinispirillia bacterium]
MANTNVMDKQTGTVGFGSSVVDSNRFYSMLLDARTANVTESMHDVAENLLKGEKDNAKLALDQLWALKKTLTDINADDTLELLITYYQDKINALRQKEETIKKVSKDTRGLIEEKRRKDEELTLVKSQISTCSRDLKDLNEKLVGLKKQEQELVFIEKQLKSEISQNETKIVNGLYEIILRQPEVKPDADTEDFEREMLRDGEAKRNAAATAVASKFAPKNIEEEDLNAGKDEEEEQSPFIEPIEPVEKKAAPVVDILNKEAKEANLPPPQEDPFLRKEEEVVHEPVVYPKSVVRMGGKIVGEYYHDGNAVTKDERHYIYNSRFMAERLAAGLRNIKSRFSQETHSELIKVTEDAASRVRDNQRFHFEVSTNEILNDKNLKMLSADLRRRAWEEADKFAGKLNAKIEALGHNYEAMLQEQMERCAEIG